MTEEALFFFCDEAACKADPKFYESFDMDERWEIIRAILKVGLEESAKLIESTPIYHGQTGYVAIQERDRAIVETIRRLCACGRPGGDPLSNCEECAASDLRAAAESFLDAMASPVSEGVTDD